MRNISTVLWVAQESNVLTISPCQKSPKLNWSLNKQRMSTRYISINSKDEAEEKVSLWHTGTYRISQCLFTAKSCPSPPQSLSLQLKAVLIWKGSQGESTKLTKAHIDPWDYRGYTLGWWKRCLMSLWECLPKGCGNTIGKRWLYIQKGKSQKFISLFSTPSREGKKKKILLRAASKPRNTLLGTTTDFIKAESCLTNLISHRAEMTDCIDIEELLMSYNLHKASSMVCLQLVVF